MELTMEHIRYNVKGARRKELVKAISEITGAESKYLGPPTFAYTVDYFTIDREGVVMFYDNADTEEIENLIEGLAERGFVAEDTVLHPLEEAGQSVARREGTEESRTPAAQEPTSMEQQPAGLDISVPGNLFDEAARRNLQLLVDGKASLIKKVLGVESLPIEFTPERITFRWFKRCPEAEDAKACAQLIDALCRMARKQKRVTVKEKEVANEKYAFRCFLLRLGFIGAEYKEARKILLRNLSGNVSFKDGKKKEAAGDAVSE